MDQSPSQKQGRAFRGKSLTHTPPLEWREEPWGEMGCSRAQRRGGLPTGLEGGPRLCLPAPELVLERRGHWDGGPTRRKGQRGGPTTGTMSVEPEARVRTCRVWQVAACRGGQRERPPSPGAAGSEDLSHTQDPVSSANTRLEITASDKSRDVRLNGIFREPAAQEEGSARLSSYHKE